ncbi:hypothetical protein VTI74DRAFT_3075 [Chaetomium olivicolor]
MTPDLAACTEQLTPEEAEENLSEFRVHNAFSCPFLYLPPGMTSTQLREERPFVWFNIMVVTTKSPAQQRLVSQAIKQHLAQDMVLRDEKSMDLLWGILIFTSWSHYRQGMKPHRTLMGCLAYSLVYDLVLHRLQVESSKIFFLANGASCDEPVSGQRHTDAQRAVLGCFLVASINQNGRETPSSSPRSDPTTAASRPSYADSLRQQIHTIRRQPPSELASNEILTTTHLHTTLLLDEASLKSLDTTLGTTPKPSLSNNPDLNRHTILAAQLTTTRHSLDLFSSIPPSHYLTLPLGVWDQTAHFLIALFRLTSRVEPAWDGANAVRAVVDVSAASWD